MSTQMTSSALDQAGEARRATIRPVFHRKRMLFSAQAFFSPTLNPRSGTIAGILDRKRRFQSNQKRRMNNRSLGYEVMENQSLNIRSNWLSIASNATSADGATLLRIVPHWLRVFGSRLSEIVIVVDGEPLEGRIAELHRGQSQLGELREAIRVLERDNPIVRFISLKSINPTPIQRLWFGKARPVRCQAGTPILAFAAAVDQANQNIVLRCDSDMLFYECGWLDEAIQSLQEGVDVYEPPRLHLDAKTEVSTRAFMVARQSFYGRLPLGNLRLDIARILHRMFHGRPPWIPLEKMMSRSVAKGQLSHKIGRNTDLGFSLHGMKRSYTASPWFGDVVCSIEAGQVPGPQRKYWDFHPDLWGIQVP